MEGPATGRMLLLRCRGASIGVWAASLCHPRYDLPCTTAGHLCAPCKGGWHARDTPASAQVSLAANVGATTVAPSAREGFGSVLLCMVRFCCLLSLRAAHLTCTGAERGAVWNAQAPRAVCAPFLRRKHGCRPDWILVDGLHGGSGVAMSWEKLNGPELAKLATQGWMLAGGLNPSNVRGAAASDVWISEH